MLGDKTLLQNIIDDELDSFIANNSTTYESIKEPLDLKDGSFIFEVNSSSVAAQTMLSKEFRERVANFYTQSPYEYTKQLGERIIKLDIAQPFTEVIKVIYDTYKKVPNKLAGVLLLTPEKGIINPLHPLVALELLNNPGITIDKILLFTYKNLQRIDDRYSNTDINKEEIKKDISMLLQIYQSRISNRAVQVESSTYDSQRQQITQNYKVSKFKGEDSGKEYYMVAHQLLTMGTYVPYYGTSLIILNGETSGFHLTPFKSCNLNRHDQASPASVCTGNKSNRTIEGLRTLHHANLSSPYESHCMTVYSKPYADECINTSFMIFQQANLIPKD